MSRGLNLHPCLTLSSGTSFGPIQNHRAPPPHLGDGGQSRQLHRSKPLQRSATAASSHPSLQADRRACCPHAPACTRMHTYTSSLMAKSRKNNPERHGFVFLAWQKNCFLCYNLLGRLSELQFYIVFPRHLSVDVKVSLKSKFWHKGQDITVYGWVSLGCRSHLLYHLDFIKTFDVPQLTGIPRLTKKMKTLWLLGTRTEPLPSL